MADKPTSHQNNTPSFAPASRTVVITGERVARVVQLATRVSRMEQRFVQLTMARPAIADKARRAMERFHHAANQMESEIGQIEKELEASTRADQPAKPRARNTDRQSDRQGGGRNNKTNDQGQPRNQDSNATGKDNQPPSKAKQPDKQGQQTHRPRQQAQAAPRVQQADSSQNAAPVAAQALEQPATPTPAPLKAL
ncbi:hypothetical protein ACI77O_12095 [Pseudomonas tritici]|uniref:hypothetical protein n=1 Tax=Pseudomonas tritici TaxID=2745518 RepID=UPI00387AAD5B